MPDHFMKLGTRYVNYPDKKKKKNTNEKKKSCASENQFANKKNL